MLALAAATLVVCAPGYPGSTEEAQPAMDALARSLAKAAHLAEGSLAALYEETEPGCMRRLAQEESSLLLATLPNRIDDRRWNTLETAFLRLAEDRAAREALDGVRMAGFQPLDDKALAAARTAYRRAR